MAGDAKAMGSHHGFGSEAKFAVTDMLRADAAFDDLPVDFFSHGLLQNAPGRRDEEECSSGDCSDRCGEDTYNQYMMRSEGCFLDAWTKSCGGQDRRISRPGTACHSENDVDHWQRGQVLWNHCNSI